MNVIEIEEHIDVVAAKDFISDEFIFDFMNAFDAPKATVKQLRQGQQNASDIGGILWRRNLHYIQSLNGLVRQALDKLQASKETAKQKVRYIVSTDGIEFGARDLKTGETLNCLISELGLHFGFFLPLANIERYKIADENPVDIKATGRLAKLYDAILMDNPTWKGDEKRHALNHFMTQIVFCLFAEDTGIFAENLFSETIVTYCETDSTQAKTVLTNVFTAMSLSEDYRSDCPAYAKKFPFVNGGLFKGEADVPRLTRGSVRYLIDAGQLDWREINPDIFGSMIQSIVNEDQRGELGMHYTSVPNILKVLDPLFLDDLRKQVLAGWDKKKSLHNVLERLSKIRVFDPACGSGNFLVIAYRELREIEIKVINRLAEVDNYSPPLWSHVELKNFYGIEYADFAAETARLSLWIAEYQMNSRYEVEFGRRAPALPLKDAGNIVHGNALRLDWEAICPHSSKTSNETYIVGNPPYYGRQKRSEDQQEDMKIVFGELTQQYGNLDYVCCWILKAVNYFNSSSTRISCAFVSTNSISQGEQVALLWGVLNRFDVEINFAHTSFKWANLAGKNAGVTCVIIGLSRKSKDEKTLISGTASRKVRSIGPYLSANNDTVVTARQKPLGSLSVMDYGSMANDGGNLILLPHDREELLNNYPDSRKFIKRIYGGQEFIRSVERYCLWIDDNTLSTALEIPPIRLRIDATLNAREKSTRAATRKLSRVPHLFTEIRHVEAPKLIVPNLSTDRREWFASGFLKPDDVVIAPSLAVNDAQLFEFSTISSRLHMVWIKAVCGRFKTDIRYSNTLGWNTFPMPILDASQKEELGNCAEEILLSRDTYFDRNISELYNPEKMSKHYPELYLAHKRNDMTLELILNGTPLRNDQERLDFLLSQYLEMAKNQANL